MRKFLIFFPDDADSTSDVVLIVITLLAGQFVDKILLDDLARLKLLTIQYL